MPDLYAYLDGADPTVPFSALVKIRRRVRNPRLGPDDLPGDVAALAEALADAQELQIKLRAAFFVREGRVIDEYYCPYALGGGALTELSADQPNDGYPRRFHSVLNSSDETLLRLSARCEQLFNDVVPVFGESKGTRGAFDLATRQLFGAFGMVLLAADTQENQGVDSAIASAAVSAAEFAVDQADHRIRIAVNRQARFTYFVGVFFGTLAVLILSGLAGALVAHNWSSTVAPAPLIASTSFGALGAFASVFQRMSSGQLVIDFSAPRSQRYLLGALRPLIGAIFGAVVQFVLLSGLIVGATGSSNGSAAFGSFALIGFVSGFSERFATDMIERAGGLLAGSGGSTPPPPTTPPTATPPPSATPTPTTTAPPVAPAPTTPATQPGGETA
jgi:hypothetical protein